MTVVSSFIFFFSFFFVDSFFVLLVIVKRDHSCQMCRQSLKKQRRILPIMMIFFLLHVGRIKGSNFETLFFCFTCGEQTYFSLYFYWRKRDTHSSKNQIKLFVNKYIIYILRTYEKGNSFYVNLNLLLSLKENKSFVEGNWPQVSIC